MTNKCPISYQPINGQKYSLIGLRKLSPKLTFLKNLEFTAFEQRKEAALRATKMSIQGVQPKLSAKISVKDAKFNIVDKGGTFIIKPQNDLYEQLPENEDLTMKMASLIGIDVPLTGLIYCKDNSFSYFIRRFDRYKKNQKYAVEDFAQLTGNTRDTKYNWSMEKLVPVIDNFCTFPLLEKLKLFRRILFCFLTGNEDMHLKNFSLITRNGKIELSPAYDLLNTTIAIGDAEEEFALPLSGKKRKISAELLINYYGTERLEIPPKAIQKEVNNVFKAKVKMEEMIRQSFLSENLQIAYLSLLSERFERIGK